MEQHLILLIPTYYESVRKHAVVKKDFELCFTRESGRYSLNKGLLCPLGAALIVVPLKWCIIIESLHLKVIVKASGSYSNSECK